MTAGERRLALGALLLLAAIVVADATLVHASLAWLLAVVAVAAGATMALVALRSRAALAALRDAEAEAYGRIELLDRSSRLMAAPMDFEARLRELARLVVGEVADLAMIDLATPDGRLEGVVAGATDPDKAALVERTREAAPIDPAGDHPVAVALRTGEAQLRDAMSDAELRRYAANDEHLEMMRGLAYSSAIVVPLVARGHTLGVLSVLRLGNPVPFAHADVALMADLASRAAMAVDNARLFEERLAAEAQLQGIMANLAEAVTIVDTDDRMVFINEAAADLFGYPSAEAALRVPLASMREDYALLDEHDRPVDLGQLPGQRVLAGDPAPVPVTVKRRHLATGEERWLTLKASSVLDPATGRPTLAVNVIEDITDERRAHAAAAFLSEASRLLSSTLDHESALGAVAHAAVPQIADWCVIDLVDEGGRVRNVALAAVDPGQEELVRELRGRYPDDPSAEHGSPKVRRTGRSDLLAEIPAGLIAAIAVDERHRGILEGLDMTSAMVVPMLSGDQLLGTIGFVVSGGRRRFDEADLELAEELGRRAGVALENARIHRERSQIAATLQRSLLPPRLPVVPGITLAARFRAAGEANQVGGDFYDLFPVGDGWMVIIGDVTGKGPGAAAVTSLARYTLRTAALYEPGPAGIVRRLNDVLLADGDRPQMCTAAGVLITPPRGDEPLRAELVCAGHPPPYLLRAAGEVEELCKPGPLLGAFHEAEWEPLAVELGDGDAIVLYTDGVTDARGTDGLFGQDRLEAVLRAVGGAPADTVAEEIDTSLLSFQKGPQRDDVALLVLRAGTPTDAPETSVVAGSLPVDA